MTTDDPTISDNILRQAQETVDEALRNPNISKSDRAVLEVQNLFLMFLKNDHRKVVVMYDKYIDDQKNQEQHKKDEEWLRKNLYGAAIATVVMLVFNGIIFLISTLPIVKEIIRASQP